MILLDKMAKRIVVLHGTKLDYTEIRKRLSIHPRYSETIPSILRDEIHPNLRSLECREYAYRSNENSSSTRTVNLYVHRKFYRLTVAIRCCFSLFFLFFKRFLV